MNSNHVFSSVSPISLPATASGSSSLTLRDMSFFVRMRWPWIVSTILVFLTLAAAYLFAAKPTYVASTQLMVFPQVNGSDAQRAFAEDAFIDAQLEIAKSSDVLGGAVGALNLADDPAFSDQSLSLQDKVKNWLTGSPGSTAQPETAQGDTTSGNVQPAGATQEASRTDRAIARLRNIVAMRRIGQSTILEISASASNAQKAVEIADAVAQQYIRKNVQMKAAAAQQYSEWLEQFVNEQQRGLADAASALATFKANPRDQFKLAELQSATDARRTLFENTLTQYTEAKQRISYPVSDATIVSRATSPLSKAQPNNSLILAFALVVGAGSGLGLAMVRHVSDRRIMRTNQLSQAAGLSFVTPLGRAKRTGRAAALPTANDSGTVAYPMIPGMAELGATITGFRRRRRVVIGIVAVNPGGGASTIACELAVLSAISGARTLLIDAAATKSSLSRSIAPNSSAGLIDVLDNIEAIRTATLSLTPTLKFLPLGKVRAVTPAIRLSSRRTQLNFNDLKKEFDAIFVDISAFTSSPDANAIAPELDGVLLVTSYGRTSIDETVRVIDSMRNVGAEILGAIINNTPSSTKI
ncbi:polysaccharide biosynthesis tyrosine autokinase [Rhizobium mesosinicum]|uniref:Sugar transporter n=1 Tax=Rhizobium mesosinicum TaxID=335017 RepID=A0ABS7H454_9HYPH|nr:sugar transporter [Rhizobium mesosinicum]